MPLSLLRFGIWFLG